MYNENRNESDIMDNKSVLKRNIAHFGTIAFNYSVFGVCLIGLALLSTIIMFLLTLLGFTAVLVYYVILLMVTIFTVGTFLLFDGFRDLWGKGIDWIEKIGNMGDYANTHIIPFLSEAIPIAAYIILGLSIISFVCMMFDRKWEKAKPRLIFMGIVIVLLLLLIITLFAGILVIGGAK